MFSSPGFELVASWKLMHPMSRLLAWKKDFTCPGRDLVLLDSFHTSTSRVGIITVRLYVFSGMRPLENTNRFRKTVQQPCTRSVTVVVNNHVEPKYAKSNRLWSHKWFWESFLWGQEQHETAWISTFWPLRSKEWNHFWQYKLRKTRACDEEKELDRL